MAVTNVDVDDDVLAEAARLLGTTTKKDTINTALEEVIRRHRRRAAFQRLAERGARGELEATRRHWEDRKAAQRGGNPE
ncbi:MULTISPECIES: type II toxin-antitoxin system VapB family antitoxin [Streptomyces]|uniref:Antitoxin VapB6 n=1 Tax=Streptomyces viridochromogenes TaxID=1938 RepID=A0A0L8KKD7_STRVR|nr:MULTISPECIES: type II toxin-antitoxin system VapB family antitoxin [Streptomyces]KOG26189.1 antitoxin VapB6 [Streptomyces viridochromogenes]